jgi:Ankyrin repeats (3 copies)/Ankyrin repeat
LNGSSLIPSLETTGAEAILNDLFQDCFDLSCNGSYEADGHDLKIPMKIKLQAETGLQQRVWSTVAFGDATDLSELLKSRHLEEARRLLEAFPENGLAAIHQAARRGNLAMLTLVLEQGVNASAADRCAGRTALHLAVQGCHDEVAMHLVREVSDIIDWTDWKGQTALHYATIAAQHRPSALKLCELLLDAEADPEACDLEGVSPLELACGNSKLEELLEKYVCDLESKFAHLRLKVENSDDDI